MKKEILPMATYTAIEARDFLCIGRDALTRRIHDGRIKASLLGNRFVILGRDLLVYLESEIRKPISDC